MRAVVQKCNWCKVDSEGEETASISKGFVVLLGVKKGDTEKEAEYIADKILHLRIFEDENDKLNLSLLDVKGELAIVSQFTLYGDARKGAAPAFHRRSFRNGRMHFMNMSLTSAVKPVSLSGPAVSAPI